MFSGISIYYAESLDTIGANLQEVKTQCIFYRTAIARKSI